MGREGKGKGKGGEEQGGKGRGREVDSDAHLEQAADWLRPALWRELDNISKHGCVCSVTY